MSHVRTPARASARIAAVLALVPVVVLAGCTASKGTHAASGAGAGGTSSKASPSSSAPVPPATLTVTPANAAGGISPSTPITVAVAGGQVGLVSVTAADGTAVTGARSADGLSWSTTQPLAYGTAYTVSATASNSAGQATTAEQTLTTVKPGNYTLPSIDTAAGLAIEPGGTYGVGQALDIRFDEKIGDRAAAQKAVTVTTDPPQTAAFSWTDDQNMMWRTENYLTPGTKVTVTANVYGVQVGAGLWGQKNVTSSFVIGDSHISVADDATKLITVYQNGVVVRTMKTSMGQGGYITSSTGNRISLYTNSGPHIVIMKAPTVHMTSASFGLPKTDPLGYDTVVQYGVKISADGEYTHAAPWNHELGVRDESHGCLNLSTTDAQWMYNFSQPGDIVDVKGTPQALQEWNSGSWTVPWAQWVAGSAVPVS